MEFGRYRILSQLGQGGMATVSLEKAHVKSFGGY